MRFHQNPRWGKLIFEITQNYKKYPPNSDFDEIFTGNVSFFNTMIPSKFQVKCTTSTDFISSVLTFRKISAENFLPPKIFSSLFKLIQFIYRYSYGQIPKKVITQQPDEEGWSCVPGCLGNLCFGSLLISSPSTDSPSSLPQVAQHHLKVMCIVSSRVSSPQAKPKIFIFLPKREEICLTSSPTVDILENPDLSLKFWGEMTL